VDKDLQTVAFLTGLKVVIFKGSMQVCSLLSLIMGSFEEGIGRLVRNYIQQAVDQALTSSL
jgi:hypothetical protein